MSTTNELSQKPEETKSSDMNRREFLQLAGLAAAGLVAAGCQPKTAGVETIQPLTNGQPSAAKARVAIGKAADYKQETIDRQVSQLIDELGGLGDVVKSGDSVAIKVNLTGGTSSAPIPGYTAQETFVTHPEVVRALIRQVQAAGAKEVYIVESVYEWASYTDWGYEEIAAATGAKLVDLNNVKPFDKFQDVSVGDKALIYKSFIFNQILTNVNVFMSVSKMKNHNLCGVTHTIKNSMGLVPYAFYRVSDQDTYRSGIHGAADQTKTRLPRTLIDLNKARPIHFSLIDGVRTAEAGEGPWITTMTPIQPGVLLAGKNALATDSVATAVMGHDPTGDYPNNPFLRADNHLNLAAAAGMGTNRLDQIEVVGAQIAQVKTQFTNK